MTRIPMSTGDEFDALTRSRRVYNNLRRAGVTAAIKRGYRRRERRTNRNDIRKDETDGRR